jgi:hypothetical protein
MCLVIDLQMIFNTYYVSMFMFYFRNKFHVPSSNSALLIETKPKAKENIRKAVMFSIYILQK